jgi:glycosyltransferase involved in cell wall biosynthesis
MPAAGPGQPALTGLRIAIVNWRDPWHPEAGGAEVYAWEMARGLLRRGAAVTFVTALAQGQRPGERREGVRIVRFGGRFSVYPLVLAWLLRRRRAFDVVIDCQNGIPFFTPWVLPRAVPVFCVLHHVHDAQFALHFPPVMAAVGRLLEGPVARATYRRHQAITVSRSTATAMTERLRWAGPVHIVPNGLSAEAFRLPADAAAAGAGTMTWVGRIVAHKRAGLVLDVAERVRDTGLTIDVIGRGPGTAELADGISLRGLGGVVRLRGFLSEEAKRAAVGASLLHLNTSLSEGWGLCVLEAAALGVPTVAYDVEGLRDSVRDGETGWLARAGERIEDVAERALKELADPARRAEVAAACQAWASRFDWDASAARLASLIATATGRPGADVGSLPF